MLDIDPFTISDISKTYLPDLQDGYVYINENQTWYPIQSLITIGLQRGISTGNSTIIEDSCNLCYGKWIVRNSDGSNIDTSKYIDQTITLNKWFKYLPDVNPNIIDNYQIKIVQGVDTNSLDVYLSFNTVDVVNYINSNNSTSYSIATPFDVYLLSSIDNNNGMLLYAGSN
jgi:hypothetical protein